MDTGFDSNLKAYMKVISCPMKNYKRTYRAIHFVKVATVAVRGVDVRAHLLRQKLSRNYRSIRSWPKLAIKRQLRNLRSWNFLEK